MKMEKSLVRSAVILIHAFSASTSMAQHQATQEHGHAAFCDVSEAEATPILNVSDFDASGLVSEEDVGLLQERIDASDYVAFFDRNADRRLDQADVELARQDIGSRSAPRDQQLAMAYQHTEAFRDQSTAVRKSYAPFTQAAHGHGAHWVQNQEGGGLGYSFAPGNPVGLNYASDGTLWGVFYYIGPSPTRSDGSMYPPRHRFRPLPKAPKGFEGDEDVWHWHARACFIGRDAETPSLDPADYEFLERLSPRDVSRAPSRRTTGNLRSQTGFRSSTCSTFGSTNSTPAAPSRARIPDWTPTPPLPPKPSSSQSVILRHLIQTTTSKVGRCARG